MNADYTINNNDKIKTLLVITGMIDVTITLPSVADNMDRVIEIIKVDIKNGKVIIDGEGAELINNSTTYELAYISNGVALDDLSQNASITIKSDGTKWHIINNNGNTILEYKNTAVVVGSAPAADGTWYNPLNHELTIPIGIWDLEYEIAVYVNLQSLRCWLKSTLSTINNAETDIDFTTMGYQRQTNNGRLDTTDTFYRKKRLYIVAPVTYYLNIAGNSYGGIFTSIATQGVSTTTFIRAYRIA